MDSEYDLNLRAKLKLARRHTAAAHTTLDRHHWERHTADDLTDAGTYELVVSFAVEPPPSGLPVSGDAGEVRTVLNLWPGIGGVLMLALGIGLRQITRRAPKR